MTWHETIAILLLFVLFRESCSTQVIAEKADKAAAYWDSIEARNTTGTLLAFSSKTTAGIQVISSKKTDQGGLFNNTVVYQQAKENESPKKVSYIPQGDIGMVDVVFSVAIMQYGLDTSIHGDITFQYGG